jgi:hypothetical protein
MEIHNPKNEKVIDYLYVGMSEDPDGKNGICGAMAPGLGAVPMVTASEKVLDEFQRQAVHMARLTGKRIKFYKFVRAELFFETEQP